MVVKAMKLTFRRIKCEISLVAGGAADDDDDDELSPVIGF